MKKKIAVIGSGISGISVAYFLSNKFDVHVYEKMINLVVTHVLFMLRKITTYLSILDL